MDIVSTINKDILKIIDKKIPIGTLGISNDELSGMIMEICDMIYLDLLAMTTRDPATKGSASLVYKTYTSFKAVMYYRIANSIYYNQSLDREISRFLARDISEEAKKETLIEIHPGAKINKQFVIDHGTNTVIGETCEIGENCYILQGVVLGSRGISDNPTGKRHPTIGHNVDIGAFVKIFGPITIGNNVKISPNCVITFDIPSDSSVMIVNQLQISKSQNINPDLKDKTKIYGIVPDNDEFLLIYGNNFDNPKIDLLDSENNILSLFDLALHIVSNYLIRLKINVKDNEMLYSGLDNLKIMINNNSEISIITHSIALNEIISNLLRKCKNG